MHGKGKIGLICINYVENLKTTKNMYFYFRLSCRFHTTSILKTFSPAFSFKKRQEPFINLLVAMIQNITAIIIFKQAHLHIEPR